MKIKVSAFLITLVVSLSTQGGLWEKMTTIGAQTVKP